MQAHWEIVFYTTPRGDSPVEAFLDSIDNMEALEAVVDAFDLIQEFGVGPHLGRLCRHIEGELWELKPDRVRLFYCCYTGRRVVVLHGYWKQSQRAPKREIRTALRRWSDWLEREAGA